MDALVLALVMLFVVVFIIHCPILKPWFGFRRPKGLKEKWFS